MRPSALFFASVLSSSVVLSFALGLSPKSAFAQGTLSDSDRAAARELYVQGVQLQQAGKYAEALDKFQRAQSVLAAPTHQLHIAQCQAALGKLVEAAETYRALGRNQLSTTSPAAFQAAVAQGNAELPQVDSRIPELKIDVTPANASGLQVTIDDQAMSAALVGVSRPINPGTHKIAVSASGYGKSEQTLTIKERETKAIAIALQATSGPIAVLPASPGGSTALPPTAAPGPTYYPPPTPAPYEGGAPLKTVTQQPSTSFYAGVRVGAMIPGGGLYKTTNSAGIATETSFGERSGAGGAIALEVGFRVAKTLYLGIDLEGAALSGPSSPGQVADNYTATYSSQTGLFAGHLGIITNPHGVGFYGDLGAGYRVYTSKRRLESQADSSNYIEVSETLTGPEFLLAAGIYIKVTESLRIIPKVQFGFGSFGSADGTCTSSGGAITGLVCNAASASTSIPDTVGHTFVFLGVGGYFGHDFK